MRYVTAELDVLNRRVLEADCPDVVRTSEVVIDVTIGAFRIQIRNQRNVRVLREDRSVELTVNFGELVLTANRCCADAATQARL